MKLLILRRSSQYGFSLIELLTVVAIIGILSSIVIAGLSGSRDRASDGTIKTRLTGLKASAEAEYSRHDQFQDPDVGVVNVCNAGLFDRHEVQKNFQGLPVYASLSCKASQFAYRVSATLRAEAGKLFCIDSAGFTGVITITSLPSDPSSLRCQIGV